MNALHSDRASVFQRTTGRIQASRLAGYPEQVHDKFSEWLDGFLGTPLTIELELTQRELDVDLLFGQDR